MSKEERTCSTCYYEGEETNPCGNCRTGNTSVDGKTVPMNMEDEYVSRKAIEDGGVIHAT